MTHLQRRLAIRRKQRQRNKPRPENANPQR